MSDAITIDMRGLAELQNLIHELSSRSVNKANRRGISKGCTPFAKAVRRNAPKDEGLTRKSINRKVTTYPSGVTTGYVGPDRHVAQIISTKEILRRSRTKGEFKKGQLKIPANYARLVDKGHGGPHPAPPHPFMLKSFDESKSEAEKIAIKTIIETLEKDAEKLGYHG